MKPCKHNPPKDGCRLCWLYQHDSRYRRLWGGGYHALQVACTADGVGDVLLGLTAVAGLRRQHPDAHITYALLGTARIGAPWLAQWARLFSGPDEIRLNALNGVPTYFPHDTYDAQNRERLAKPRWEYYADACGTTAALPKIRPLGASALAWAKAYCGAVVLSPFSAWKCRSWLPSHWLYLERLLVEAGHKVVILDGRTPEVDRARDFRGVVLRDEPAERVAAVMLGAKAYVGSDSGLSHLAGLVGTPSVVMSAQIRCAKLFGLYPSIMCLDGPLGCGGCHWNGAFGWAPHCDSLCANLQMIEPPTVMNAIMAVIEKQDSERVALPTADKAYLPSRPVDMGRKGCGCKK